MADTQYTLADLEAARAEVNHWSDASANDSSNNPNKYHSQINEARMKVKMIETALKDAGVMPLTDKERLERELDNAFPDAQSKQVVEHKGKRYMRRFYPVAMSRSGKTVHMWDRGWEELTG